MRPKLKTRANNALILPSILAIGLWGCITTHHALSTNPTLAQSPNIQSIDAGVPTHDGDATTNAFLGALKIDDFATAVSHFDAALTSGLSQEKLAVVWTSQKQKAGNLIRWTIEQRAHANGNDIQVAHLKFERGELQALLSIAPQTQKLTGLFLKPLPKAAPPPAYVDQTAFRSEEATIGKSPFALSATLTRPNGNGPFAAAVLVHGSGPNDRNGSIGANKPLKDLAEGLSSRGIIVIRYDKRTFQHGHQLKNNLSIDDEVIDDAVSAVKHLKDRSDVDPQRIFIIGHSLGALLAPEIAHKSAPVAGAVLLAPPGRAPWDVIVAQMKYLEAPADKLALAEAAADQLRTGQYGPDALLGVPASYWKDWASHDGVTMAKLLKRPLLIMRGDRDYQVTDDDIANWRSGLQSVSNVEFATVTGSNHLFIKGTGKSHPSEYEIAGHVDELVIHKIVSFIQNTAKQ